MDETETIPYASPKDENDIDDSKAIVYASPKRENEDEIDQKVYKEPKLEPAVEIEKQAVKDEKKLSKVNKNRTRLIFKLKKNQILKSTGRF